MSDRVIMRAANAVPGCFAMNEKKQSVFHTCNIRELLITKSLINFTVTITTININIIIITKMTVMIRVHCDDFLCLVASEHFLFEFLGGLLRFIKVYSLSGPTALRPLPLVEILPVFGNKKLKNKKRNCKAHFDS